MCVLLVCESLFSLSIMFSVFWVVSTPIYNKNIFDAGSFRYFTKSHIVWFQIEMRETRKQTIKIIMTSPFVENVPEVRLEERHRRQAAVQRQILYFLWFLYRTKQILLLLPVFPLIQHVCENFIIIRLNLKCKFKKVFVYFNFSKSG